MSTATVLAPTTGSSPAVRAQVLGRVDVLNLGLLLVGFACLLLLVPPARSFPITDDWAYARSVTDLLRGAYKPHDAVQATALGHIAWGALGALLFGNSFVALSLANLVMGLLGAVVLYLLLRQLEVAPPQALLGSTLLGLNPIYVYLGYSFMTDVTFTVYLLAGCLCLVRAMQGYGDRWLWLGGLAAALAYLTRQYGILLVPAALLYFRWSRKWTWRRAVAVALLPLAALAAYTLWQSTLPQTMAARLAATITNRALQHPVDSAFEHLQRDAWLLQALGLFLLPVLRLPKRPLTAMLVFAPLALLQVRSMAQFGSLFPQNGDVIDHTGFLMYDYYGVPVWPTWLWAGLGLTGALVLSLYGAYLGERAWAAYRSGAWRAGLGEPVMLIYFVTLLLVVVVLVAIPVLYDRYALPLVPLLALPALRRNTNAGAWRWLLISLLGLFTIIAERDYLEHASVRWQAAQQLAAQGVPVNHIDAGTEWAGWNFYDAGARRIRETQDYSTAHFPPYAVLDPVYMLSDVPREGYTEVAARPYHSWLSGGQTRHVLVLKRNVKPEGYRRQHLGASSYS